MKSREIRLTRCEAVRLARKGGFKGNPTFSTSKSVRRAFGEGLVRGWLEFTGHDISDRPLLIRAKDFGLEVFPSLRRFRSVEL